MSSKESKDSANPFTQRLKALAKAVGGSGKFANLIGWKSTTISPYLNGTHQPGREILARMIEKTGCSGTWLLTGKGPMWPPREKLLDRLGRIGEDAEDYSPGYAPLSPRDEIVDQLRYLATRVEEILPDS